MLEKKHEMLRKLAREFAEKEIAPIALEMDEKHIIYPELLEKLARYQFTGITMPKEYGGAGGDFRSLVVITEEFCRKDGSAAMYIMGNSLSGMPYLMFGTEEQKEKYLKPMITGERIGAFALTEPGAGSDAASITTVAVDCGDYYLLNGRKTFITMGPMCDQAVVFAKTDPAARAKGITAFIVEMSWDGCSKGKPENKLGVHSSPTSDLIFEDVRVPKENVLGKPGQGFKIAMSDLNVGRVTVSSQALGIAQGALDEAIKYAKERIQFGKTISKMQGIQFKLAEMATKVQAARWLVYDAAKRLDLGQEATQAASMAKLYASEIANQVAYDAMQIHGGYGYMKEYPIEKLYRDARITSIYEGTSEIQKVVIAGNLLR